jgi:hypothetical protein
MLVAILVLAFATLAVGKGKGRRSHYTFTSENQFADPANLFDYLAPTVDGTLLAKHLQLVGKYTRTIKGETQSGDLKVTVGGEASLDFANGKFYGLASLDLEGGVTCAGWMTAKRVEFYETGSMVMECTDGSKERARFHFEAIPGELTWTITGWGTRLEPRD